MASANSLLGKVGDWGNIRYRKLKEQVKVSIYLKSIGINRATVKYYITKVITRKYNCHWIILFCDIRINQTIWFSTTFTRVFLKTYHIAIICRLVIPTSEKEQVLKEQIKVSIYLKSIWVNRAIDWIRCCIIYNLKVKLSLNILIYDATITRKN